MDTFELLEQTESQIADDYTPTEEEIGRNLAEHAEPITQWILEDIRTHPEYFISKLESARELKEKNGIKNPSVNSVVALAINQLWGKEIEEASVAQKNRGNMNAYVFLRDMAVGIFETTAYIPLAEAQLRGKAEDLISGSVGTSKDQSGMAMDEALLKYRQIRQIAAEAGRILKEDSSKSGIKLMEIAAESIAGKVNRLTQTPVVDRAHTALYLAAGAKIAVETYKLLLNLGFAINESNN